MNIQQFFVCSHRSQCFWAVRLLVFLAVAVILWPQCATGQHPVVPKITLSQVEQLVSSKVPDSTLSAQIQRRGLAFAPTPAIVDSLRAKGAGPLTVAAIEALFPKGTLSAATNIAQLTVASGFNGPAGIAVDGRGNILIADQYDPGGGSPVKELLAEGGYATVKALGAGFAATYGVAVDGSGNIFVAETGRGAVNEILAEGGYTTVNRLDISGSRGNPWGLAVDRTGNVFVAYQGWVGEVKEIPSGCTSARCVKILGGGFGGPHGVAVDGRENIFVADNDGNAVKEIPSGCNSPACVRTLGGGFSHPQGVAVDGNGNLFVTDTGNNSVKEIPTGCASASCVRTLGSGFSAPWGVAVDRKGNVFIADAGNHRVVELEVAGSNTIPDAMAIRATSANEFAVVFDPPSNVRVAPSATASILCSVAIKATIHILGSEGNWYKTDTCEGKLGYIHRSQVKF